MRRHPRALLLALLVACSPALARAEGGGEGRLVVELLTVEPGDDLTNMFGHSALLVTDRELGTARVWNWGTLEWAPEVPVRFVSGPMTYFLSVEPLEESLYYYREENRRVSGQVLDLTEEQAAALLAEVEQNALPDRRDYAYHHFHDNCATRVRDVVDRHAGGALRRAGHGASGRTWREHGYFAGAAPWPVVLGFDLVSNATWEREPSDWAATFMPLNLRDLAREARLRDGRPLVREERVHLERVGPDAAPVPFRPGWAVFGLPVLLLLLSLALPRGRRPARLLASSGLVLLGLLLGLSGLLAAAAWALTAHADFARNENLLHLWPTDLAIAALGRRALEEGRRLRGLRAYLLVHLGVSAVALGLAAVGLLGQGVWPNAVPALAGLAAALLVLRRGPRSRGPKS